MYKKPLFSWGVPVPRNFFFALINEFLLNLYGINLKHLCPDHSPVYQTTDQGRVKVEGAQPILDEALEVDINVLCLYVSV